MAWRRCKGSACGAHTASRAVGVCGCGGSRLILILEAYEASSIPVYFVMQAFRTVTAKHQAFFDFAVVDRTLLAAFQFKQMVVVCQECDEVASYTCLHRWCLPIPSEGEPQGELGALNLGLSGSRNTVVNFLNHSHSFQNPGALEGCLVMRTH